MKKISLFFILVIVLVLMVYYFHSCHRLSCLTMASKDKFRIKEIYQEDNHVFRALLTYNQDLLRVQVRENISEGDAVNYINGEIARMKGLFTNAVSPYPGELSDEIVCGNEFTPTFSKIRTRNTEISSFTGYLNNRLVFGSCMADQEVYKGTLSLFYCPSTKQTYQIEIIAPRKTFESADNKYRGMLQSISCR